MLTSVEMNTLYLKSSETGGQTKFLTFIIDLKLHFEDYRNC